MANYGKYIFFVISSHRSQKNHRNLMGVYLCIRPICDICIIDLEKGQGHIIRGHRNLHRLARVYVTFDNDEAKC